MPRRVTALTAVLLATLAAALAACAGKPPASPPRATCVLGEAAVDQCVIR